MIDKRRHPGVSVALVATLALVATACGSSEPGGAEQTGEEAATTPTGNDSSPGEAMATEAAARSCAFSGPEWDDLIAAAEEEGELVVSGAHPPEVQEGFIPAFEDRFGIDITFVTGRTSELLARLQAERAAGQYTHDVMLAGASSLYKVALPEGMLQPVKDLLIGSEIQEPDLWINGRMPFQTPEEEFILRLNEAVVPNLVVNTDRVETGAITSFDDLLKKEFADGEIVTFDPTSFGAGGELAAYLYHQKGEEYMRDLYLGQEVTILSDNHQIIDDLARGRYSVAIGALQDVVVGAIEDGLPVEVVTYQDIPIATNSSSNLMAAADTPANPNATQLFVNWMACPEGMESLAVAVDALPTRVDVDVEPTFDWRLREEGVEYFDLYDWEFVTEVEPRAEEFVTQILEEQ